ncbi:putative transcription factor NIGTH1 [Cocos nucifera]|uniref:Putative transcription factor NIGTH1 n=1 Tax=Cocos nucifera TaxID=13894 RepID=A0A8K0I464_COCNU|nr:putative transcription factor NIGTH1 [Cocos nucifera]
MVSAQLWSPANDATRNPSLTAAPLKETEHAFDVSPKLALDTKQRNGGAFLPFSKEKNKGMGSSSRGLPELALASSEKAVEEKKSCVEMDGGSIGPRRDNGGKGTGGVEQGKGGSNPATEGQPAPQTHRKARRCWSPDLHRRFVNALQILGGSQAPQASVAAAPQLVVLGSIWVPPEYATSAAGAGPAIYGAHAAQAHYCPQPLPQELYAAPPPPHHHHHHHHLHPPLHRSTAATAAASAYKNRLGSPESEVRSGGERSESIEEEEEGEEREEEEEEEEEDVEAVAAATEGKVEEKALVPLAVKTEEAGGRGGEVALKI